MFLLRKPRIKLILITGGPSAGKSIALNHLSGLGLPGVGFVHESATQCRKIGLDPRIHGAMPFQDILFFNQLLNEERALRNGFETCGLDRGLPDGGAYVQGGILALCERYGVSYEELLDRYYAIIYLTSIATDKPELYRREEGNLQRVENTANEAAELDRNLWGIYAPHPRLSRIPCFDRVEDKVAYVREEFLRLHAMAA